MAWSKNTSQDDIWTGEGSQDDVWAAAGVVNASWDEVEELALLRVTEDNHVRIIEDGEQRAVEA